MIVPIKYSKSTAAKRSTAVGGATALAMLLGSVLSKKLDMPVELVVPVVGAGLAWIGDTAGFWWKRFVLEEKTNA